jgi:hypothetical protein
MKIANRHKATCVRPRCPFLGRDCLGLHRIERAFIGLPSVGLVAFCRRHRSSFFSEILDSPRAPRDQQD